MSKRTNDDLDNAELSGFSDSDDNNNDDLSEEDRNMPNRRVTLQRRGFRNRNYKANNICDYINNENELDIDNDTKEAEDAAIYVHLNPYSMSNIEQLYLPDFNDGVDVYCSIRNDILSKYKRHVNQYLTLKQAKVGFTNEYVPAVERTYDFLNQFGFINSGIIQDIIPTPTIGAGVRKSIIVIGAGMSGVTAARKLMSFGHKVKVIEARKRVGGRCYTETQIFGGNVDLGASIITGLRGNPIYHLTNQINAPIYNIRSDKCPIFKSDGLEADSLLDSRIEHDFNKLLDITAELRKRTEIPDYICLPYVKFEDSNDIGEIEETITPPITEVNRVSMQHHVFNIPNSFPSWIAPNVFNEETHFLHPLSPIALPLPLDYIITQPPEFKVDFVSNCHGEGKLLQWYSSKEIKKMSLLEGIYISKIAFDLYHAPEEQLLFNWHIANLEYGCAANLNLVSMCTWDQDDHHDFSGAHCMLPKGYSHLVSEIAAPLDLVFESPVETIDYNHLLNSGNTGVKIVCRSGLVHESDIVLVTVPLGVLKSNAINFQPELPAWKSECISRFGFGLLNKVVMKFSHIFWDNQLDMFGTLRSDLRKPDQKIVLPEVGQLPFSQYSHPDHRGYYYIFWNLEQCMGQPVLVALVAGTAAYSCESDEKDALVNGALSSLQKIYGADIPVPLATHCTSWYSEEFSRGTYSYISVGSSGDEYDILARPIDDKLFFAGEATWRYNPSTVAGAYLSGLRAAAVIENVGKTVTKVELPSIVSDSLEDLEKKINDRRLENQKNALFLPDYSAILLKDRIEFERKKQAQYAELVKKQEQERLKINDLLFKIMADPTVPAANNLATTAIHSRVQSSIANRYGMNVVRPSSIDSDFSIIKARPVVAPNKTINPNDSSIPTLQSFSYNSASSVKEKSDEKSDNKRKQQHKRAKSSIAGDKVPTDPEAFSNIKDFIKRQIHDLTISAKLEKDDYKAIAKKATDKVYVEWKEKRRKWNDFFHDKRQSKIVELIKSYILKYRNKPSKL